MAIQTVDLFKYFSRAEDGVARLPAHARIRVGGTVVGVSLRHDKTAVVALAGDDRGRERVECRCVSDQVLRSASVGSRALLEGACAGLEDSVTLVLEQCELLEVQVPSRRWRESPVRALLGDGPVPPPAESALELFERHAAGTERHREHPEEVVEAVGTVVRCFLRHDKVACASLAADPRGVCLVECRFLSDEVLPRLRVGSRVTIRGACQGLEDSLTLVLERCDLLNAEEDEIRAPRVVARRRQPEALPGRVTAGELFDRCSRSAASRDPVPLQSRFDVTGPVEKAFLKRGVACVSLRAAPHGPQSVECRCLSDEVLAVAARGETVTLRGFLTGFDDSVTLVLERCEVVRAGGKTRGRN